VAVLVAGIGNLFLSDDGFGPEVVRQLAAREDLPAQIKVVDYGIRGMHLAYDLLDGYDALVLVDALPGDGPAGTITVLEVGPDDLGSGDFDPHGMAPVAVLASVHQLGGSLPPTYVVGCRPETVDEGIGLSDAVTAAIPQAIEAVRAVLSERMAV
jgi:hydrogenase maturation protease